MPRANRRRAAARELRRPAARQARLELGAHRPSTIGADEAQPQATLRSQAQAAEVGAEARDLAGAAARQHRDHGIVAGKPSSRRAHRRVGLERELVGERVADELGPHAVVAVEAVSNGSRHSTRSTARPMVRTPALAATVQTCGLTYCTVRAAGRVQLSASPRD